MTNAGTVGLSGFAGVGSLRAKYVLVGAAMGLVIAIVALLAVSAMYGDAIGLSVGSCAAFACTLTVLLSQPVGLAGMIAGALVGTAVAAIVSHRRHGRA